MARIQDSRFKQLKKMSAMMSIRPTKQLGLAILRRARTALNSPRPMVQQTLF